MEFYCDFFRNFLEFYDVCKEKELFYSFDILNDDQNHVRIILGAENLFIIDMKKNIDLLFIRDTKMSDSSRKWLISDVKETTKDYKEDPITCILIHGRNLFPDCFSDFSEQEKQKILSNMIACLNHVIDFVD